LNLEGLEEDEGAEGLEHEYLLYQTFQMASAGRSGGDAASHEVGAAKEKRVVFPEPPAPSGISKQQALCSSRGGKKRNLRDVSIELVEGPKNMGIRGIGNW